MILIRDPRYERRKAKRVSTRSPVGHGRVRYTRGVGGADLVCINPRTCTLGRRACVISMRVQVYYRHGDGDGGGGGGRRLGSV